MYHPSINSVNLLKAYCGPGTEDRVSCYVVQRVRDGRWGRREDRGANYFAKGRLFCRENYHSFQSDVVTEHIPVGLLLIPLSTQPPTQGLLKDMSFRALGGK